MAAPTILAFGNDEQQARWLRPLWTGEEIWCQLFSEPGAGSDLAGLATRAVHQDGPDGGQWVVNGQKVWTSWRTTAQWGLLLARTDPDVPKHAGLTYFACDMTQPGVEVRPLRQLTGEAEFNEVFLTDVVVRDADRIGDVGAGWQVATATLMNERVSIGGDRAAPGRRDDRLGRADLAGAPGAAHPRAARPAAPAVGRRRGGPAGRGPAPPAAGRGPARPGGVRGQDRVRPAEPGDHPRSRWSWPGRTGCATTTGRCAGPARSTSTAATPATGTCAPGATRSRAAPRRSCATSSPSGCSACRPRSGWTRSAMEGPAAMSTDGRRRHRGRDRRRATGAGPGPAVRRGPRPSCGTRSASLLADRAGWRDGAGQDRDQRDLRHRAVAGAGRRGRLRRAAHPGGPRRRRGRLTGRRPWSPRRPAARSPRCPTWAARWSRPRRCWPRRTRSCWPRLAAGTADGGAGRAVCQPRRVPGRSRRAARRRAGDAAAAGDPDGQAG